MSEGLAAHHAHIRCLAAMDALVLSQVGCLTEGLAALGALIWPLSSMSAQMLEEV